MNFLLRLDRRSLSAHKLDFLINQRNKALLSSSNILEINYNKNIELLKYNDNRYNAFFLGDLVVPQKMDRNKYLSEFFTSFSDSKIRELKGHFYLILIDINSHEIKCFNSMFSILPIYLFENTNSIIISSSIQRLYEYQKQSLTVNKKFIVEKLVFNYAFLDDTIYNEVRLLPSNHYIKINNKLEIIKHTSIENYFTNAPQSWRKAIEPVSELFLSTVSNYFPANHFYITLTGGFDGRTLVGCALNNNLNFSTLSYGSEIDKDITIPSYIANKIDRLHHTFILDQKYAQTEYIQNLENIILNTDCNASLSRSHYSYIAREISLNSDYLLSGNFGSEIIRTWRIPGVMTSEFLLKSFETDNQKKLNEYLNNYSSLRLLHKEHFKKEIEELTEQIFCFKEKYSKTFSRNQVFYIYFFEQIFRKYFGPEIVIQNFHSLFNRTPFIDFVFLREILKTELAGANGRYLERNPFLRFRGQILYSHILKKINSPLLDFPTDRGYKPKDFFSIMGKTRIFLNYLNNNLIVKKDKNFTQYNELCFQLSRDYFSVLSIPKIEFNQDALFNIKSRLKSDLSQALSIMIYLNKLSQN